MVNQQCGFYNPLYRYNSLVRLAEVKAKRKELENQRETRAGDGAHDKFSTHDLQT